MTAGRIADILDRGADHYLAYKDIIRSQKDFPIYNLVEAEYAKNISQKMKILIQCIKVSTKENDIHEFQTSLHKICNYSKENYSNMLKEISQVLMNNKKI